MASGEASSSAWRHFASGGRTACTKCNTIAPQGSKMQAIPPSDGQPRWRSHRCSPACKQQGPQSNPSTPDTAVFKQQFGGTPCSLCGKRIPTGEMMMAEKRSGGWSNKRHVRCPAVVPASSRGVAPTPTRLDMGGASSTKRPHSSLDGGGGNGSGSGSRMSGAAKKPRTPSSGAGSTASPPTQRSARPWSQPTTVAGAEGALGATSAHIRAGAERLRAATAPARPQPTTAASVCAAAAHIRAAAERLRAATAANVSSQPTTAATAAGAGAAQMRAAAGRLRAATAHPRAPRAPAPPAAARAARRGGGDGGDGVEVVRQVSVDERIAENQRKQGVIDLGGDDDDKSVIDVTDDDDFVALTPPSMPMPPTSAAAKGGGGGGGKRGDGKKGGGISRNLATTEGWAERPPSNKSRAAKSKDILARPPGERLVPGLQAPSARGGGDRGKAPLSERFDFSWSPVPAPQVPSARGGGGGGGGGGRGKASLSERFDVLETRSKAPPAKPSAEKGGGGKASLSAMFQELERRSGAKNRP